MNFLVAQIIGVIVTLYAIISTQFKSVHALLIANIITNVLSALNYILLGGASGTWVCVVAAVQAILMDRLNAADENQTRRKNVYAGIFVLIYIVGSLYCFQSWLDILPCLCALIYTLCVYQKNVVRYKGLAILNSAVWAIYDLVTGAYTMIITRVLLILMSIFSIYKIKRKETRTKGA